MNEYIQILVICLSCGLFALGGTKGKFWRRYVLPVLIGALMGHSVALWAIIVYVLTLSLFLHMGYGERATWVYRFVIFCGYSLPCLWIGWSWWIPVVPFICSSLFLLSNWKPTENMFFWKGVEAAYGYLIAISLISTVNGGMLWKW